MKTFWLVILCILFLLLFGFIYFLMHIVFKEEFDEIDKLKDSWDEEYFGPDNINDRWYDEF